MYQCNCCGHIFNKPDRVSCGSEYWGAYKSEICELCPECESDNIECDEEYDEYEHWDRDSDI